MNLIPKLITLIPRPAMRVLSRLSFSRSTWKWKWLRRTVDRLARSLRQQDGVILEGVGKGLRFNVGKSRASFLLGTTETEVQSAMEALLKPGMVVYDLGANVGFHACIAARLVGESGKVVCFEPVPENARQIKYNAALNRFGNFLVREEAIGGKNGTESFLLSAESTFGALASANLNVAQESGQRDVPVRTLDSVIAENGMARPDWIKMDVEGSEIGVLSGGRKTLLECRPILVIELHDTNKPIAAALEEMGYATAALDSPAPVAEAYWNAMAIAVPKERADLLPILQRLRPKSAG